MRVRELNSLSGIDQQSFNLRSFFATIMRTDSPISLSLSHVSICTQTNLLIYLHKLERVQLEQSQSDPSIPVVFDYYTRHVHSYKVHINFKNSHNHTASNKHTSTHQTSNTSTHIKRTPTHINTVRTCTRAYEWLVT